MRINWRIWLVLVLAVCFGMLSGCSTLGNGKIDNPIAANPYQAGRTFVFVDTISDPFQPAEVAAVIDQVHAIANMNIDAQNLADEFVRAQINELYADSTPEARASIFAIYKAFSARLLYQIELNPNMPEITVLSEFNRGVRDALAIYQPKNP